MLKDRSAARWGKSLTVIHKCVNVRHANTAVKLGADIISMDGYECAGHPGMDDIGGLLLFAIAAKGLKVPFIASGGIGDGNQLAACLALGAEGVNMGTRFMATKEAFIHDKIKQVLVDGDQTGTMTILRSMKNTERVYKNQQAMNAKAEEDKQPGNIDVVIKYISGSLYKRSFQETGNTQDSVWSCGQVMGLIDDVPTVETLVKRIVTDAQSTVASRLNGMLSSKL